MTNICDDLLIHLYGFIPYQDRHVLAKTDTIFKKLFQKDIGNIILIQRFFQKHKLDEEYMNNAGLDKYNH